MIERIIEFSIRNRVLVILAGFALALWGVYAVYHTPVDAIPDLSENQVLVFTEWPGHSPREIEDQVTYPLSLHLQGLAGVRVVRSSSEVNFSMISVIFEDAMEIRAARQQVGDRLAQVGGELPPGVHPAMGPDAAATGQIYWYTLEGPGLDLGRLRAIQDWYVRPQLSSVPGVAEVATVGGRAIEYVIEVKPELLQAHGLTMAHVAQAVRKSNAAAGGDVVHKGNAEYVVRSDGWLGSRRGPDESDFDPRRVVRDLEQVVVPLPRGGCVLLAEVAHVGLGAQPRRGVLEKDGSETTGGVVLMRHGENPLEVTRRIEQKIHELQTGLPGGVRLMAFYDRTPLIENAVGTVTGTLVEAIITASVVVLLVLLHFRTSFVITLTLPLAVLASFAAMWTLRRLGVADIQTNIMSLAGIAISIGVLVDSSVVMAENVMHTLREQFGDQPVRGDTRPWVLAACRTVGRPIFFSVVIMLLSFLPVFALGGMPGKMFHPLAFTKSFALVAVAVLAITLVPALCTVFIKGRLRRETDSWLVRGVIEVYRPVLLYLLDRPAALVWFLSVTFLICLAPLGLRWVLLTILVLGILAGVLLTRRSSARIGIVVSLVLIALIAEQNIQPLGWEFVTPLDEGMVMDMPITVPRASIAESADDLKARDMILCRFPEVDMVVGKAGRAETSTDPAPLDMIETMVNFRPLEFWPKRKLRTSDAERQAAAALDLLAQRGLVQAPSGNHERADLLSAVVGNALPLYDAQIREYAYQRNREFERELGGRLVRLTIERAVAMLQENGLLTQLLDPKDALFLNVADHAEHVRHLAMSPTLDDVTLLAHHTAQKLRKRGLLRDNVDLWQVRVNPFTRAAVFLHTTLGGQPPTFFTRLLDAVTASYRSRWREHVDRLNGELLERAPAVYTRLVLEEILSQADVRDPQVLATFQSMRQARSQPVSATAESEGGHHHHGGPASAAVPDPIPGLLPIQEELTTRFTQSLLLWPSERVELAGFGGELDRVMQMPGWTNVWTMPIQNRVDMLATGVNTSVGVRVLGRNLDDVVRASEEIAAVLKRMPGAVDVVADPVRGKGYLNVQPDRARAAQLGVSIGDINDDVETALGGKIVTLTMEGRERHPVRVRYPRAWREDEESVRNLLVPALGPSDRAKVLGPEGTQVPLADLAEVSVVEGPASIKSENGLLRNYVRLNVRGRDASAFVEEARQVVAGQVQLPSGVFVEWTGQFEHEQSAHRTLLLVVPLVVALIFLILYLTYHDLADAVLMLLAVPGAFAGGVIFQWLFGSNFSVTVWVGYIACLGMATATGIIMLVYLREAVARAGGLENMTVPRLRQAVLDGAVHRLRPKLLTECTCILGLAPLLWSSGTGAEVIKPMILPVIGGLLIADEVIDLFLPVLFYWVRRRRLENLKRMGTVPGTVPFI